MQPKTMPRTPHLDLVSPEIKIATKHGVMNQDSKVNLVNSLSLSNGFSILQAVRESKDSTLERDMEEN